MTECVKKHVILIRISLLTFAQLGCDDLQEIYPVSGSVLIDGKPLRSGAIRFVPERGRPATSEINANGTYRLTQATLSSNPYMQGIIPGKYRVAVYAVQILDEDLGEIEWLAPSKYADHRSSELVVVIDRPHRNLVVDLTWEGHRDPNQVRDSQMESVDGDKLKEMKVYEKKDAVKK